MADDVLFSSGLSVLYSLAGAPTLQLAPVVSRAGLAVTLHPIGGLTTRGRRRKLFISCLEELAGN